jgi:hypothetical protein
VSERREALKIIGAVGTTCAFPFSADELYGQHAGHGAPEAGTTLSGPPKFFTVEEFRTVSRLADLIIPETEAPGAVSAGVPLYIDYVVSKNAQAQKLYREGLRWLDAQSGGKRFADLTEQQQIALLTPLCEQADAEREAPAGSGMQSKKSQRRSKGVAFFKAVKSMTADGYFTSKAGLVDALRYRGNTVLAEFPACTHEH